MICGKELVINQKLNLLARWFVEKGGLCGVKF